jgi:hypothetical protein
MKNPKGVNRRKEINILVKKGVPRKKTKTCFSNIVYVRTIKPTIKAANLSLKRVLRFHKIPLIQLPIPAPIRIEKSNMDME